MKRITFSLSRRGRAKAVFSLSGLLAALLTTFSVIFIGQPRPSAAQQGPEFELCRTEELHRQQLANPVYRRRREMVEQLTSNYLNASAKSDFGALSQPVTIPVVVHVVYNTPDQNISDAQIHSQIAVLNEDFRRLNADAGLVPAEFSAVAADARIQFQLAVRDPNCNPTNGITRTQTSVSAFGLSNGIKFASSGGHDAWPTDKYLNIWVGWMPNYFGYAQYPGGNAATDGVVVRHDVFGRGVGPLKPNYDLGRTATHEVGHWLHLYHTFGYTDNWGTGSNVGCHGTSAATCATQGDRVCDTPPVDAHTKYCPATKDTCYETPTNQNDQTMNYMDYTYDACKYMFTVGQAQRMEATLFTVRAGLIGSDALTPPAPVAGGDLWMQDSPKDTGAEPNATDDPMWISNDIWVRNTNDGIVHQEHQNPVYNSSGASNYVYVRVRNRSCLDPASATVQLYWAKASTGLSWKAPWDGSITSPALMGSPLGAKPTGVVQGGDSVILEFEWKNVPNPADYASFGADKSHFCLLARIGDDSDMTYPETTDLYSNVMNNNNIVQKNVTILASGGGGGLETAVTVGNLQREPVIAAFVFAPARSPEPPAILRWGAVTVDLGADLFAKWQRGGAQGSGIRVVGRNTIQVLAANAQIFNVRLEPRELHTVKVRFKPYEPLPQGVAVYDFTLEQHHLRGRAYRIVGGEKFVVKTDYRR